MLAAAACAPAREGRVDPRRYRAFFLWAGVRARAWLGEAEEVYVLMGEVRAGDPSTIVPLRPQPPRGVRPALWLTLRAERLDLDATLPFATVATQIGDGARLYDAGDGLAGIERAVTILGRDLTVRAEGTVVADGGQLLIEPRTVDLGGPDFLDSALSSLARSLVTIRQPVPGVPDGLGLTDVAVTPAGFDASLSGTDVTIGR